MASLAELVNLELPPNEKKVIAEYIWIGGYCGIDIRSKARTLTGPITSPSQLPKWNFDGSSTAQAPGDDSEVILYPQAIYKDPFRRGNNILVMCDCYTANGVPHVSNKRAKAVEIFEKVKEHVPWFGIKQEYNLLSIDNWPLGWPKNGYPGPQGPYYCGVGADKASGRDIMDAHYKACIYAGITISGTNGEVMPSQWEYQVGPCTGIASGDELWVSRYILERITETAGVVLSLDSKPIKGDWNGDWNGDRNGAGCHTNYSTKEMREDGGYEVIKKAINKLGAKHIEHIVAYNDGIFCWQTRRYTATRKFSWGVANRGASIRVRRDTVKEGKGYFEDRRPTSKVDPYVVTSMIAKTTILCADEVLECPPSDKAAA